MTIVDTSVWIDYFANRSNAETLWLDRAFGTVQVGLTDLILCEILQGLRDDPAALRVHRHLAAFPVLVSGGQSIAVAAAFHYRSLRAKGYTVRTTVDCLIATVCLLEGSSLLHKDRDFQPFEQHLGLRVVHA